MDVGVTRWVSAKWLGPRGEPISGRFVCAAPALGDQLVIPSGLPRSLEAAVQRYGSASFKAPAATVLDPNGKMFTTLTYGTFAFGQCFVLFLFVFFLFFF